MNVESIIRGQSAYEDDEWVDAKLILTNFDNTLYDFIDLDFHMAYLPPFELSTCELQKWSGTLRADVAIEK